MLLMVCTSPCCRIKTGIFILILMSYSYSYTSTSSSYIKQMKEVNSDVRWMLRVTVARLPIGTAGLLATQVKFRPLSVSKGEMGR